MQNIMNIFWMVQDWPQNHFQDLITFRFALNIIFIYKNNTSE